MNENKREQDTIRNLRDAGCDEATIQAFLDNFRSGRQRNATQLLERHRRSLLNDLHAEQKRIDCLDYLLFMLRRQNQQ